MQHRRCTVKHSVYVFFLWLCKAKSAARCDLSAQINRLICLCLQKESPPVCGGLGGGQSALGLARYFDRRLT